MDFNVLQLVLDRRKEKDDEKAHTHTHWRLDCFSHCNLTLKHVVFELTDDANWHLIRCHYSFIVNHVYVVMCHQMVLFCVFLTQNFAMENTCAGINVKITTNERKKKEKKREREHLFTRVRK